VAFVLQDRVKETTATTGTGTFTLGGTSTGFVSFSVIGNGNETYYTAVDNATGEWEVGIGTYNTSTLTRDTVLASSSSGSKVPFAVGSKDVFVAYPAEKAVTLDTAQTLSNKTLANADLGTPTAGVLTNGTGLPLTTGVTGTLPVGNGGTGVATLTGYVKASGTSAFAGVASIPAGDISGLGTMATQNANNVAITGGAINGATVGASTAAAVTGTTVTANTKFVGTNYDAANSAGGSLRNASGAAQLQWGAGGGNNITFDVAANLNPANANISIAPTGTGTVTINPATAGTINNMSIGATTASTGKFTQVIVDNLDINGNTIASTDTNGNITLDPNGTGAVDVSSAKILNVATPTNANDGVNKQYVDTLVASSITYHTPVKYEVPIALTATYNQPGGAGVGVGATLTNAGTLAAFAPDGPTVASVGDRILIYNQASAFQNGVYTVTTVGDGSTAWVLTRATDADTYAVKSPNGLGEGDAFFVTSGSTGAGETYVCNTQGTITFGSTAINFVQIASAQIYSAGTGLTLSGLVFSITPVGTASTYGSASQVPVITTNVSGQVSSVTNTSIAINGNQITSGSVGVAYGGTGQTSYTNGQLLIGNTTGNTLTKSTLTAGSGISITNGAGSITIAATGGGVTAGQSIVYAMVFGG